MFCIVGLGNPGDEYTHTRHNVGWTLIERIVKESGLPSLTTSSAYSGLLSEGVFHNADVGVLLPTTFMNNSGTAVGKYVKEKASLETLIVVHDDVDLPFGDVRIGFGRGAGGHNGVTSIIDTLHSKAFVRIRIGIARRGFFGGIKRPKGDALSDFVLGEFGSKEKNLLPEIVDRVQKALELLVTKGVREAMQECNK